jgi:hypothetical protein
MPHKIEAHWRNVVAEYREEEKLAGIFCGRRMIEARTDLTGGTKVTERERRIVVDWER